MVPVMAHLCPGDDYQALLFRFPPRGNYAPAARRVHGYGLFDKDMLAGLYRRLKVQRPKQRRRRHQHNLYVGLQQVSIATRAAEAALGRNIQLFSRSNGPVFEVVGGRDDPDVEAENLTGFESAGRSAATPAAAADETYFEGLAPSLRRCPNNCWSSQGNTGA